MTNIVADSHSRAVIAPRWIVAATFLLSAAIVLSGQALSNTGQPTHTVAWGSVALAAYAASLLCLIGGGKGRWLGLGRWWFGSWTLLWYGVAFGLASLTWVHPQPGSWAQISLSSVARALWLVAVGITLWVLGYLIGPGRPVKRFGTKAMAALGHRFTSEVRSPLAPWILYAIGTAARIAIAATTGRFGYVGYVQSALTTASGYQQWLALLGLCAPMAVAAAALQVYRESVPGARVTLTVLFLAEIASGAIAGGKESFIVATLAVAIPFVTSRRKIHKGLLVFAVLGFFLVIVPFNHAYRSTARAPSGPLSASQAIGMAPGILQQTIAAQNVAGVFSSSIDSILTRIREIDNPAIILQRTPAQISFQSPVQLIEAPIVDLIPRAVWPSKPVMTSGYQFGQIYYGVPATDYTSFAVTPLGDLYMHGGWIPALVGMFLLGCGVRFLDEVLDVSGNPHSIFLFLLLFTTLVNQEDDWTGTLDGIPGTLLVWLLAVCITFRRTPRRHRSPEMPHDPQDGRHRARRRAGAIAEPGL